jgi:hypothetical protein
MNNKENEDPASKNGGYQIPGETIKRKIQLPTTTRESVS